MVSDRASEVLQFYSDFIISCTGECYKQLIPSASFQRQVRLSSCYHPLLLMFGFDDKKRLQPCQNENG